MEESGARIVSFDAILKYGKYPLAKALSEIMDICRKELLCEVEIEFAADVAPSGKLSLKLLQVRPISSYSAEQEVNFDELKASLGTLFLESGKALGNGFVNDVSHIVYIAPDKFNSLSTREIAAELAEINNTFKSRNEGYILIGPGRWGSSDPNLGIPVIWSDISEATLRAIIAGKKEHHPSEKKTVQPMRQVNLLVDIQAKLQAGKGAGYERWAKVFNLKQMAQTLNYLSENNLMNIEDLTAKTDAAIARVHELQVTIRETEKRMAELHALKGHIIN